MPVYTIRPLDVGQFPDIPKPVLSYMNGFGEVIRAPIVMFAIEGAGIRIVVDTGPGDPERAIKYHRAMEQTENQHPRQALKNIGWNPEEIDMVVLTHLHWDHCGNNPIFKQAEFIVQEHEVRYAISPLPIQNVPYEAAFIGTSALWLSTMSRFKTIRGDKMIAPGITAVHLPGHTPGFQGVLIETEKGPYLIAGDCIPLFENWTAGEQDKYIPHGVHTDLFRYYRTFDKIEETGAPILPGHDLQLLDKAVYP
ncbi:MAG: N-acyl homoserine lactonase family protein [Deltaproteobacteria bacterium]|nr:N-acyl homoserine lactonase family protein [Deltaproteobacteria bacterium]